jgi:hypothetical protein
VKEVSISLEGCWQLVGICRKEKIARDRAAVANWCIIHHLGRVNASGFRAQASDRGRKSNAISPAAVGKKVTISDVKYSEGFRLYRRESGHLPETQEALYSRGSTQSGQQEWVPMAGTQW